MPRASCIPKCKVSSLESVQSFGDVIRAVPLFPYAAFSDSELPLALRACIFAGPG